MEQLQRLAAEIKSGEKAKLTAFLESVHHQMDVESMRALASSYTPYDQISIPLYRRILELRPSDVNAIASIAWIYWSVGEEAAAYRWLSRAKKFSDDDIQVLTLEAALGKNPQRKREIYQRVLAIEPNNRVAQENLSALNEQPKHGGRKG